MSISLGLSICLVFLLSVSLTQSKSFQPPVVEDEQQGGKEEAIKANEMSEHVIVKGSKEENVQALPKVRDNLNVAKGSNGVRVLKSSNPISNQPGEVNVRFPLFREMYPLPSPSNLDPCTCTYVIPVVLLLA